MNARVICESGVRNCQLNCPWCARLVSLVRRRETHPVRERWRVYKQIMYNAKLKVPWLIGTKHFPESKRVLDSGNYFVIISVLDSAKCFWILGRVSDSGKCFVPTSHCIKEPWSLSVPWAYAMRTSVINSQTVLILRLTCHYQGIYEQIIFCKTGLSICIFLHK